MNNKSRNAVRFWQRLVRYQNALMRGRWLRTALLFAGVLLPLLLFGELAEDVLARQTFSFDRPILLFMKSHATPMLDNIMLFVSQAGSIRTLGPCALALAGYLIVRSHWFRLVYWVLGFGGAVLLNMAAKHVFTRVRPDLWVSIAPETSYSFPSGHAMQSMAFVAALMVIAWDRRGAGMGLVFGVAFVALVGLSRVYLGVHFPSDVLAGWTASLAWCIGLAIILGKRLRTSTVSAPQNFH
jgi:membrane-associated phospholipid phosphatase